ncbi:helix-turn-helix transcriptional regulator [Sphingomonas hengshuiensis]|uniref:helix-turn-helix transcriptional regulator n=1 Tax=Sphingomonas hengshuiensis TaxID=1609977 RepID=UPI00069892BE|nr:LuxR family transcriptional regulator [Sphingomonas hengshuiensis]
MAQVRDSAACLNTTALAAAPFAANLSRAQSRRQAFELLAAEVRRMGFENLCLSIENAGPFGIERCARWSTLDSDRQACLDAIGFDGHDPIRRFARKTSDPFLWSRGDWPGERSATAREIMAGLHKVSIGAGMSVAIWGRAGRVAIADAFGPEDWVRTLSSDTADLFFLACAQTVRLVDRYTDAPDMPALTRREIEILELAAQGLSSRLIAIRLEIVEPTVKFHFKGIRAKLNAGSKAEAVARFASLGPALDVAGAHLGGGHVPQESRL